MTTRITQVMFKEIPKFVKLIETKHPDNGRKAEIIKVIIDDVFTVSVHRGLNDGECSLLLDLFCKSSHGMNDKLKLLKNLVPEKKVPAVAMRKFLVWFFSNFRKDNISVATSSRILQWIIGLLEHNLVDSSEIYNFYFDFYIMLEFPQLVPYVAKLLCKLSKPDDVTGQTVRKVYNNFRDPSNKYILAVLNVFKGYKPHLMLDDVRKVDVLKVLKSVHQEMDSFMRVRVINSREENTNTLGICKVPARKFTYFKEELHKISSLIPLPTYNFEGTDKFGACYPNSIDQAFRNFSRVPIPQNIMSLLHNNEGFFTITYQGIEEQMRFQNSLLQALQSALIYQELKTSDEDVEFLFRRIYCLQTFMKQGIPSVSVFLSGYLLDWKGVEHRRSVLKLIEWATFHSFRELGCNILRPLHMLFVTYNTTMRKEIIETLVNLIINMFDDVYRVQQGLPFPFLKRGPKWTKEPESMLISLISWTQNLITLGFGLERDSSTLLMESIKFYEMINVIEASSNLQMFTVVPEGLVLQSLLSQSPNAIISICRLLLRYHKQFLPQLRMDQPRFYEQCKEKISLTSNYAKQIIYFLQNGQVVVPRKDNGIIVQDVPNEALAEGEESFCLASHMCFVATYVIFESRKNLLNLSHPTDKRTSLELAASYLREIKEFVNCFSSSGAPEAL